MCFEQEFLLKKQVHHGKFIEIRKSFELDSLVHLGMILIESNPKLSLCIENNKQLILWQEEGNLYKATLSSNQ